MTKEENLALLVRNVRESKGLSVRHVARKSGLASSTVSRIENAKMKIPKVHTLRQLAKGLGTDERSVIESAGYVYDGDGTINKTIRDVPDGITENQLKVAYLIDPKASEQDIEDIKKILEIAKLTRKDYN